jgi:HK97 family phage major capsid protein
MELTIDQIKTELEIYKKQVEDCVQQKLTSQTVEVKSLQTELEKINKSIADIKQGQAGSVPGLKEELAKKAFSFGNYISAQYKMANTHAAGSNDPWRGAEYEREIIESYAKTKANTAGDGSAGGYLIPPEVTSDIIDLAIAQMPIFALGATVLKGLTGELPVPKLTGRTTAYHVGENVKPTVSQNSYGVVYFRPKKVAAYTKQSNRLIYQSKGVSDKVIRQSLSEALALEMQHGLMAGVGSESEPLGVFNHTGFTTSTVGTAGLISTNGGRFRVDHAANMQDDLDDANELAMPGSFGYLMSPRVKGGLKRERVVQYSGQSEANGAPVMALNPLMSDKVLSDILGYQIKTSTLVPKTDTKGTSSTCSRVLFGNWTKFWIGMWRDMQIKVSDQAGDGSTGSAFLDDQLYILVQQEYDCHLVRATAMTQVVGAENDPSLWV